MLQTLHGVLFDLRVIVLVRDPVRVGAGVGTGVGTGVGRLVKTPLVHYDVTNLFNIRNDVALAPLL